MFRESGYERLLLSLTDGMEGSLITKLSVSEGFIDKHPSLESKYYAPPAKFRRHLNKEWVRAGKQWDEEVLSRAWSGGAEELHPSSRWRAKTRQGQVSTFYLLLLTNCSLPFNDHKDSTVWFIVSTRMRQRHK